MSVIISDDPSALSLPVGYTVNTITDALSAPPAEDGLIIIATSMESHEQVAQLCHRQWEHRAPVILMRCLPSISAQPHPANMIVDVTKDNFDDLVGLLVAAFGGSLANVRPGLKPMMRGRDPKTLFWLRGDPRPGPMLRRLREFDDGFAPLRAIAYVPMLVMDAWEHSLARNEMNRVEVVPMENEGHADVLVFLDAEDYPKSNALHPLTPPTIPSDPRGYDASVLLLLCPDEAARHLAEMHLVHEQWGVTGSVLEAIAAKKTFDVDEDDDHLTVLTDRVLELLGFPVNEDDAAFRKLRLRASAAVAEACGERLLRSSPD